MDWVLRKDDVCVVLRQQAGGADSNAKSCNLQVVLKDSGIQIPLVPGNKQTQTASSKRPLQLILGIILFKGNHF